MVELSRTFHYSSLIPCCSPATPTCKHVGLDSSAFARRYLRNLYWFLLLWLLRCFTSPGVALKHYLIHTPVTGHNSSRVSPFRNPRIIGCLLLPEAYRSLLRLSSPTDAKAFTVCPYTFALKIGHLLNKLSYSLYAVVKDQFSSEEQRLTPKPKSRF